MKMNDQERSDTAVFIILLLEVSKLSWLFKGRFKQDTKQALEQFLISGKLLTSKLEKIMGEEGMERFEEVGEGVGVFLDIARSQNEDKLLELLTLIKEWEKGNVVLVDDFPKTEVA